MINGLFLDPRSWKIDFLSSSFWNTEKYGVKIDLHSDAFNIPKIGVDKKYKFVIASEVWEIPIQKTLEFLSKNGLKVFLAAREPIKYGDLIKAMFEYKRFFYNNSFYYKPDVVLAAGKKYKELWDGKTKAEITGYPRWDWYIDKKNHKPREQICKKYGIDSSKKIIFFSDFPPIHYKKSGDVDVLIDIYDEKERILKTLENFVSKSNNHQVIIKIHPVSMKAYLKKSGILNAVSGTLKKYLDHPTNRFKVIGDVRFSGEISKELLLCSDLVVGYNSTMLLEATLVNKPVIQTMFGACKSIQNPYYGLYKTAFCEEELFSFLENESNIIIDESMTSAVYDYFYAVDGGCCKRICSSILNNL